MKYYVDLPYPEVRVEKPNLDYAMLLSGMYAGKVSEETIINLYIYEHIALLKENKDYSEVLKKIAIVEMHHLETLGQLINLLGLKPIIMCYDSNEKGLTPWKSNYLNYSTDFNDIIDLDIKAEENAIKEYNHILSIVKDKYVIEIIERIIMDEELHLKIFKDLKNKL